MSKDRPFLGSIFGAKEGSVINKWEKSALNDHQFKAELRTKTHKLLCMVDTVDAQDQTGLDVIRIYFDLSKDAKKLDQKGINAFKVDMKSQGFSAARIYAFESAVLNGSLLDLTPETASLVDLAETLDLPIRAHGNFRIDSHPMGHNLQGMVYEIELWRGLAKLAPANAANRLAAELSRPFPDLSLSPVSR